MPVWELWDPGRRLWSPGADPDQRPFWEDRSTHRQLTCQLWFCLETWKKLVPSRTQLQPHLALVLPLAHAPAVPGRLSPTCALGNRHTNLGPGCGPWCAPWINSSISKKTVVWEPLENTDLDNYPGTTEPFWTSRAEKLHNTVGEKTKHPEDGCIEKGKRHSFTLSKSAFPQGGIAQCQESPSWPPVPPTGESECVSVQLPHYAGYYQRGLCLSYPTQSTKTWDGKIETMAWNRTDQRDLHYTNHLMTSTGRPSH